MSSERAVKAKIRAAVKGRCYIQSMSSYATNGTPDLWCSGRHGDLWLEVKYDPKTVGAISPKLSTLQRKWLLDRHAEGRNVAVYVATSLKEGVVFRNGLLMGHRDERIPFTKAIDLLLDGVE